MFGKNQIRSIVRTPSELAVQEIFYTIQGEGPYSGHPATFIRLAGCNLACTYCDTEFESNIGNLMAPASISQQVLELTANTSSPAAARKLVVITGGEPFRQSMFQLVVELLRHGVRTVQVETAGTLWDEQMRQLIEAGAVILVCSPKTPKLHPMISRYCSHYKYVLQAGRTLEADGLPVGGTQAGNLGIAQLIARPWLEDELALRPLTTVWVSPCDEYDADRNKANQDLAVRTAMQFGYRLSLQTHKLVGVP